MIDLSEGECSNLADASYREDDPFFPEMPRGRKTSVKKDLYAEARAICGECPIRDKCLEDALTDTVQWGFRAGLTPEELQKLKPAGRGPKRPSERELMERTWMAEEGFTDAEIAKKQGVSPTAVRAWRVSQGLKSRYANRKNHTPEMQAQKMELWEAGATDQVIADTVGCASDGIRRWRSERGLKPNRVSVSK